MNGACLCAIRDFLGVRTVLKTNRTISERENIESQSEWGCIPTEPITQLTWTALIMSLLLRNRQIPTTVGHTVINHMSRHLVSVHPSSSYRRSGHGGKPRHPSPQRHSPAPPGGSQNVPRPEYKILSAISGSFLQSPPNWTHLESLQREATRSHPEPPQPTRFYVEEQL